MLSPATQMSHDAVCHRDMEEHRRKGAVIHAGQLDETVIQYPDHYLVGSGMSWQTEQGQWKPRFLIFDGDLPTTPGEYEGHPAMHVKRRRRAIWIDGQWMHDVFMPGEPVPPGPDRWAGRR